MISRWFVLVRKFVEMLLEPALASTVMHVEIEPEPYRRFFEALLSKLEADRR